MPIKLDDILEDFINPPVSEKTSFFKKKKSKEEIRYELTERFKRGQYIKDFIKTPAWQEIWRPRIIDSLKSGFAKLLRPSGLDMTEKEIKVIMAKLQENISIIADMRYAVDEGDAAGKQISEIGK